MKYNENGFNLIYEDEKGLRFRLKRHKKVYTFENHISIRSSKIEEKYFYIGAVNKNHEMVRKGRSL